ncbi:MAG: hypothetical protein R3C52_10670 [Hyphomonadaceae bacterium]
MRVLCAIVLAQSTRSMDVAEIKRFERSTAGRQPVSDHRFGLTLVRSKRCKRRSAALVSRRFGTTRSSTSPSSSTARQMYTRSPPIVETISSKCQRGDAGNFRLLSLRAMIEPNLAVQQQIVS